MSVRRGQGLNVHRIGSRNQAHRGGWLPRRINQGSNSATRGVGCTSPREGKEAALHMPAHRMAAVSSGNGGAHRHIRTSAAWDTQQPSVKPKPMRQPKPEEKRSAAQSQCEALMVDWICIPLRCLSQLMVEASPPRGSGEGIESILDIDSKSNSLVVFSRRGATGRKLVVSNFVCCMEAEARSDGRATFEFLNSLEPRKV